MSGPLVFAVTRQRLGGRFTYTTPHWPDARRYLVGLLEEHAAQAEAAAELDVARQAHAAARGVPVGPPAHDWSVRVGGCRYQLSCQDVAAAAAGAAGSQRDASPTATVRPSRGLWTPPEEGP